MKQWCIVQFQNGGTENSATQLADWKSAKIQAAVKKYELPTEEWLSYEPCNSGHIWRSWEGFEKKPTGELQHKWHSVWSRNSRKSRHNPIYNTSDTEEEVKKRKLCPALRLLFPVSNIMQAPVQSASRVQTFVQPSNQILPNHPSESSDQMCSSSPYLTESSDSSALPAMYPCQEPSSKDHEGIHSRSALAVLQWDQYLLWF